MGWSTSEKDVKLMRILMPLHGFVRWNGGLDLARLMTAAIERASDREAVLCFAIPKPSRPRQLLLGGLRRLRALTAGAADIRAGGDDSVLLRSAREISRDHHVFECSDNGSGVLSAAHASKADVIFPTMLSLGKQGPPKVGYLFDFQHRYLPDLFPKRVRRNRDRQFNRVADDSTGLVVNSRFVARDVERFLGYPRARILAMPFSPYTLPWWFDLDPAEVQLRYGLHARYLLVCNHFWKHKDHATALRAFSLLRTFPENGDLQLVMTGDPIDHRDPGHYDGLHSLTSELGITNATHFLGLIPKRDQLALLRGSTALLQPTRFEGGPGGGSVYEAIGLGIPSVVSDIPVNLEIDQGDVRFFHAGDPDDLAAKAADVLSRPTPKPIQESLLAKGDANLARLGNVICDYLVNLPAGNA